MDDDKNADKRLDEKLGRRDFFRLGIQKAAKAATGVAEARITKTIPRFIRPPFAIAEPDFLARCSRCQNCVDACPHETVFPLSTKLDSQYVNTPALDLVHTACHLCAEWPCVIACETGALEFPDMTKLDEMDGEEPVGDSPEGVESIEIVLPVSFPDPAQARLAQIEIDESVCLPFSGPECGACGSVCPIPDAIIWDMSKPQINTDKCTGCALCVEICITHPKAILIKPLEASWRRE